MAYSKHWSSNEYCFLALCFAEKHLQVESCSYDLCPQVYLHYAEPGRGGVMTCGWPGVCRPIFRNVLSSNYQTCIRTNFCDEFWRNNSKSKLVFTNFGQTRPCLRKICRQRTLFREFWPQKTTLVGGTYLYPRHVMYLPQLQG